MSRQYGVSPIQSVLGIKCPACGSDCPEPQGLDPIVCQCCEYVLGTEIVRAYRFVRNESNAQSLARTRVLPDEWDRIEQAAAGNALSEPPHDWVALAIICGCWLAFTLGLCAWALHVARVW